MPSRNDNDDKRRMPGSTTKKQQSFVGRESPVDMTQAILQGDKLDKTISVVVKNAKTGISSVQKAHKASASSMLGDISAIDRASRRMYRAQEDDLTRVERRAVSAYARAKDAAKQMMDIDSESSRRRKELAAEEDRMLGNFSKKAEAYSKKRVKDALDSAKRLNDQIEKDKKELSEIEQRASRGKASTQDAKRAAELEKTISDNTDAYNKCRDDVSGMLDKQASTYQAIANTIVDSLMIFADVFTGGIDKYGRAFESSFTDIASRGAFDKKHDVYQVYDEARKKVSWNDNKVINISDDMIPALQEAYKKGLTGDTALTKAYNDALEKTIMPWLDTMSEQFTNLSVNLSQDRMKSIKGQQLLLQESQSGNRLLQSGVINSLLQDIAPELVNIEYNTGGADNLTGDYLAMMENLVASGYSEQEAYSSVKNMMNADKDLYTALTSGDAATRIYAQNKAAGKDSISSFEASNSTIMSMAANAGSDVGSSAVMSVLGSIVDTSGWKTQNAAKRALDTTTQDKVSSMHNRAEEFKDENKAKKAYEELRENANQKVSNTKSVDNMIENAAAAIADQAVGLPHGVEILGNIFNLLKTYLAGKAVSGIAKLLGGKGGGGLLGSLGSGGSGVLGKVVSGGKGLLGKVGSIGGGLGKFGSVLTGGATSTAMGVAGIAAGGIMMAKDAVQASKKSKEWGTSKSSAAVAGAVFGSEDKPSVKNTLKQTAKFAAIGAGIGSMIPGVGTLVGAGVGAAAGAISSLVSGKQVAQAIDKGKEKIKSGVKSLAEKTKNAFEKAKEKVADIKDKAKDVKEKVKTAAKKRVKNVASKVVGIGKRILGIEDEDDKSKSSKSSKSATNVNKKSISSMKVSKLYVESIIVSNKISSSEDSSISSSRVISVLGDLSSGGFAPISKANNVSETLSSQKDIYSALVSGVKKVSDTRVKDVSDVKDTAAKKDDTLDTKKSDCDIIVDAIRYCTAAIVGAINKNNTVDNENNLLPLRKGDVNMDIVNLYSTSPSSSTTV